MCSLDLKPPVKQQSGETCRRVMQCFSERNIVIYISHFTLRSQGHHVVTSGTGQELSLLSLTQISPRSFNNSVCPQSFHLSLMP